MLPQESNRVVSTYNRLIKFTVMTMFFGAIARSAKADVWTATVLHPPAATESFAYDVFGGQQVGGALVGGQNHASLWAGTAASWIDLNPTGATESAAYGINGNQQVGYAKIGGSRRASLWTGQSDSWVDLAPPGSRESIAFRASGGKQVGYVESVYQSLITNHASLWSGTAASWVDLNPDGADLSEAFGMDDYQQVGFAQVDGWHAGLWTGSAESWVDLHPKGYFDGSLDWSWAVGVHNGQQVGYVDSAGRFSAALWSGSAASYVSLAPIGSAVSQAFGVFDGRQVGWAGFDDGTYASLWSGTADSWVNLGQYLPAGYSESNAVGIWSDASFTYIIGYGYNTVTGRDEALLWTQAIPEPGTAALLGLSGLIVAMKRRRTR